MPMVDVGLVRMRVNGRLMVVRMRMSDPGRHARMHVTVRPVVMSVAVRVVHGFVRRLVFVTSGQHYV